MTLDQIRASFPVGSTCIVRDAVSPLTGERETLHGLRVLVVGHSGMVGSILVRLVDPEDEIFETLSSRDAWWTRERVVEVFTDCDLGVLEFEPEQLDRA